MSTPDQQDQIDELRAQILALNKQLLAQSAANAGKRSCPAYFGPEGKVPGEPGVSWCAHPDGQQHDGEHVFGQGPKTIGFVVTEAVA